MTTVSRTQLPAQYNWLRKRLARVRRYLRAVVWVESLVMAVAVLLVVAPPLFLLDNWLHFSTTGRLTGFLLIVATVAVVFVSSIRTALERWSDERIARKIESQFPDLQNHLINAIQLGRSGKSEDVSPIIAGIVDDAAEQISSRPLLQAVNTRRLRNAAIAGLILSLGAAVYAYAMPDYFRNAALRLLLPTRDDLLPITRVQMNVYPGNAQANKGEPFEITATPTGTTLPREAHLQLRSEAGNRRLRMNVASNEFRYEIAQATTDFSYRVTADDFRSRWYTVRVVEHPAVERLAVTYQYPEYTRLTDSTVDPSNGEIVALTGTHVIVEAFLNKIVDSARIDLESGRTVSTRLASSDQGQTRVLFDLMVEGEDTYTFRLRDKEGLTNIDERRYSIRPVVDQIPRVAFTSPRESVEVAQGENLNLLYAVSDDYGLAKMGMTMQAKDHEQVTSVFDRQFEAGVRALNDGHILATGELKVGSQWILTLWARDTNPSPSVQKSYSQPLMLTVLPPVDTDALREESRDELIVGITRMVAEQERLRDELGLWRVALRSPDVQTGQLPGLLDPIIFGQSGLRVDAQALGRPAGDADPWLKVREALLRISESYMRDAVEDLKRLREVNGDDARRIQCDDVRALQKDIVQRLKALLGVLKDPEAEPEMLPPLVEEASLPESPPPAPETGSDVHGAALDFLKELKGSVKSLQEMENINPEDLTLEQQKEIEELIEKEDQWKEYFKDAKEWMRESAMVGATESGLRDELLEIFSEVHMLPQELRDKKVTIEVSMENTGLELAEELTTELEKWLAEQPDFRKWVMENAPEEYDVPLADLPDELTDLIGDLIESQEEMSDDIEDVTSNWADSLDKGAGWEAADGPISNYSAKGVTGNVLPNDMDISGRAGEGRTGRSTGEMVESVATGKGGRDTQTRMTNDAMGEGQVEDLSTEATGGVTGGGKIAGTTGYGLLSPSAPAQPDVLQKLAQKQANLRQQAVSLQGQLMRMRLPGAQLERSIQSMRQIEAAIQNGRYDNLRDLGAVVVQDLKSQRQITQEQIQLRHDPTVGMSDDMRHRTRQGADEEFPEAYRTLLSAYYDALAAQNGQ